MNVIQHVLNIKGSDKVAGIDNLIPFNKLTEDEQKEMARKGGIRSGEVRKEKATMKKTLEMLLNETIKKGKYEGKTYRELSTLGLIKGAVDGKAENYKIMLQLLGELEQEISVTPELKIEIVNNENLESDFNEDKWRTVSNVFK